MVALANDHIQFPIAQADAVGHIHRPVLNGDPIGEVAPTTIRPMAFAALALTPQMPKQGPLGAFVVLDMLVNPFMADRVGPIRAQPATDLFRAPLFLQQAVDAVPGSGRNAPSDFDASPK